MISISWPSCLSLWSYTYDFQDFVRQISEINIFGTATEKERGRHIYVLIDGHVLFLKHPTKLSEAKLNFTFFNLLYFLDVFAIVYVFTINIKWNGD